jgi:uncharacterized membrane-anchored protein
VTFSIFRAVDRVLGSRDVVPTAVKVPFAITVLFWATKIVSTAMGEALADWLDGSPNVGIAALGCLAALAAFVVALRLQFRTTRYVISVYWFAVAMVATFGTMAADVLHQFLGAPYWSTTVFYAVVLAVVFWRWWANEGTLSIHSISTRRREKFYWATVLATFALGTATGDWTAGGLHLDFLPSGLLFAGVILLPAIGYAFGANPVVTFWFAYVITRPLGASFADYMDYSTRSHGLGIPREVVWGSLAIAFVALVLLLALVERREGTPVGETAQLGSTPRRSEDPDPTPGELDPV